MYRGKKVKVLLLAFLFASLLVAATIVNNNQLAYAQGGTYCSSECETYVFTLKKIVGGPVPSSNWQYDMFFIFTRNIYTVSETATLNSAGGEEVISIVASWDLTYAIISEKLKPNYVAYVRSSTSGFATEYATTNVISQPLRFDSTAIFEFSNQYIERDPVGGPIGGTLIPINKLTVLVTYLVLVGVVACLSLTAVVKKGKRKPR